MPSVCARTLPHNLTLSRSSPLVCINAASRCVCALSSSCRRFWYFPLGRRENGEFSFRRCGEMKDLMTVQHTYLYIQCIYITYAVAFEPFFIRICENAPSLHLRAAGGCEGHFAKPFVRVYKKARNLIINCRTECACRSLYTHKDARLNNACA